MTVLVFKRLERLSTLWKLMTKLLILILWNYYWRKMIKQIVRDTFFLAQKSEEATKEDLYLAQDLQDTLVANRDNCVGMAANMIGVKKRAIIVNMGVADLVMFNPVLLNKSLPFDTKESCLSLTGVRPTRRYQKIEVAF